MAEPLRLLAVFPHPDDESLGMGGTLAHYSAEGVQTYLVCATRGERGWGGLPDAYPGLEAMGRIREAELRCAAQCLGIHEVSLLDYIDGELDQADPVEAAAAIAGHIRRIRPQVVVSFGLEGNYGHPDHIAASQLTAAAILLAAIPDFQGSLVGEPFQVSKFYHLVDAKEMVDIVGDVFGDFSIDVDGVHRSHVGWEEWAISARIDARHVFDRAWQAILCHQSQLAGMPQLLELPRETLLQIFGQGTFLRAFSLVNGGRQVESDLFEGLR